MAMLTNCHLIQKFTDCLLGRAVLREDLVLLFVGQPNHLVHLLAQLVDLGLGQFVLVLRDGATLLKARFIILNGLQLFL